MGMTVRQLVALDRALAQGVTLKFNGKDYTFTPLQNNDLAEHLAYRKSLGVQVWYDAIRMRPITPRERIRDLCTLTSRSANEEDFSLGDPDNVERLAYLSLRHKHPQIDRAEVKQLVDDDAAREMIANLLNVVETSPLDLDNGEGGGNAEANPT